LASTDAGLKEEELQIQVDPGKMLRIIGERSNYSKSSNGSCSTSSSSSGQFVKLYKLPANTLGEEVRAEVDGGFIIITVPRAMKDTESTT
jgi:HSP20 family molecular chaperone IbpA